MLSSDAKRLSDKLPESLLLHIRELQLSVFLFNLHHTVAYADVSLDILRRVRLLFEFLAECSHKHPQRGNIALPTASPHLLRNIGVCQNFSYVSRQNAEKFIFYGREVEFLIFKISAPCGKIYFQVPVDKDCRLRLFRLRQAALRNAQTRQKFFNGNLLKFQSVFKKKKPPF